MTAINNDGLVPRLDPIEQAPSSKVSLVTSTLQAGSRISLGFFRWVFRPIVALYNAGAQVCHRVNTVAANIFQFCRPNSAKALDTTAQTALKNAQALDASRLISISTNQSYDLHGSLAQKVKSFAFSPSGLGQLLGVMALGATEQDQSEFAQSIGLSLEKDTIAQDVKTFKDASGKQMLGFATDTALTVDEATKTLLKDSCGLEECVKGRQSARNTVIARLKAVTGQNFPEFLKSGETDTLVHAVVLKALTATKEQKSIKMPFTFSDGTSCVTDMQLTHANVKVSNAINFTLFDIACENGLSKVVVVPKGGVEFASLYESITPENLADHRAAATTETVRLYMPAIAQEQKVDMGTLLKEKQSLPSQFLGKPLAGVKTGVYFEEGFTSDASSDTSSSEGSTQEYTIDKSFFWFIMQNNQTVIQGQVDSADGLKKDEPRRFFGLFS